MSNPITPPPELIRDWMSTNKYSIGPAWVLKDYAIKAAQWGADQELEACCEWLNYNCPSVGAHHLRADRRPKPLSLKEQALSDLATAYNADKIDDIAYDTIRRALEALPE